MLSTIPTSSVLLLFHGQFSATTRMSRSMLGTNGLMTSLRHTNICMCNQLMTLCLHAHCSILTELRRLLNLMLETSSSGTLLLDARRTQKMSGTTRSTRSHIQRTTMLLMRCQSLHSATTTKELERRTFIMFLSRSALMGMNGISAVTR